MLRQEILQDALNAQELSFVDMNMISSAPHNPMFKKSNKKHKTKHMTRDIRFKIPT